MLYNMTVGGDTDTTAKEITISKVVGRTYHVMTFTSRRPYSLETPITISVNGVSIFTGIIISMDKQTKSIYTYECRSASARLSSPFISDRVYKIEDADSSVALFSTWSNETGVPITNGMIDIDFGTKYVRNGTIGDNIISIASITKADVWLDENDVIQIQPKKYIGSTTNPIIKPTEILENIPQSNSVSEKLVNRIYVQTVDYEEKCYIEVQPNNGIGFMRISSSAMSKPVVTAGGISASVTTKEFIETGELNNDSEIITIGSIAGITSLKLNGTTIAYDDVIENTILLNGEMSGLYEVIYTSYGYDISAKRVGTSWTFQSSCGGGWWQYSETSTLEEADKDDVNSNIQLELIGNQTCYLFSMIFHAFDVTMFDVKFYWDGIDGREAQAHVSYDNKKTINEVINISDTTPPDADGWYSGKLQHKANYVIDARDIRKKNSHVLVRRYHNSNIIKVMKRHTNIPIEVTYRARVTKFRIFGGSFTFNNEPKRLLAVNNNTGQVIGTYSIRCSDEQYRTKLGCDAPIDVASVVGVDASELKGRTCWVGNKSFPIDESGRITIPKSQFSKGQYTMTLNYDGEKKILLIVNGEAT